MADYTYWQEVARDGEKYRSERDVLAIAAIEKLDSFCMAGQWLVPGGGHVRPQESRQWCSRTPTTSKPAPPSANLAYSLICRTILPFT